MDRYNPNCVVIVMFLGNRIPINSKIIDNDDNDDNKCLTKSELIVCNVIN